MPSPTLTSDSFSGQRRPAGKEFRDGTVGEALDDVYSDIDTAFVANELNSTITLRQDLVDGAGANFDQTAPFDLTIIDMMVVKTGAALNNGANTVLVADAADDVICSAISIRNVADKAVLRMVEWDTAQANIDKDGTIRTTTAKGDAGDNNACTVLITCRRR